MGLTRPGFSVYLTLGYPNPERFLGALNALSACTDFYEFGLPTPRPKYDGPTVRLSHYVTLGSGVSGIKAVELVKRVGLDKPFALMAYLEDYIGTLRQALEEAAAAGAMCALFPDLAFDYPGEIDRYVDESERAGLGVCFFASSRFPHSWLKRFASYNPIFIYLGLQPATGVELPIAVERNVKLARALVGDKYLLVGFAVKKPETVASLVRAGADAVVVGSSILRAIAEGGVEEARRLACSMHQAAHTVKA